MKLTGNYTLFFYTTPCHDKMKLIGSMKSIDIKKVRSGTAAGKPVYTFDLLCKSVHGKAYNANYGMVFNFALRNNSDGSMVKYRAGRRPQKM